MTYSNETNRQDVYYNTFKFPEFLEMIGRIAFFKYPNTNPEFAKMNLS